MASGLIALLDDVAMIARLASTSLDDVAGATAKAGTKAAGVVIDDTAVTPRYVIGLTPDRELPIIAKIALGSLRNKLFFLLPAALLLTAFAPFLITPLLMIGGSYLAFEASEKILEALTGDHHEVAELMEADTPAELEQRQVAGAIRTDFILSAEIMAIALASLGEMSLTMIGVALALVGIVITIAVYGVVALVVKLDDIGLHLAERPGSVHLASFGRGLVRTVPGLLASLSAIGTAAMLWVGGGILLHGLEQLGAAALLHRIEEAAHAVAGALPLAAGVSSWILMAIAASIVGLGVGLVLVAIVRLVRRRRPAAAHPGVAAP